MTHCIEPLLLQLVMDVFFCHDRQRFIIQAMFYPHNYSYSRFVLSFRRRFHHISHTTNAALFTQNTRIPQLIGGVSAGFEAAVRHVNQPQQRLIAHNPPPKPNTPIHLKFLDPPLGLDVHQHLMASSLARLLSSSQVEFTATQQLVRNPSNKQSACRDKDLQIRRFLG